MRPRCLNTMPEHTVEELQSILALSTPEAQAVVEFRRTHGDFGDVGDLAKVQGLDPKKLDGKKI
jgi:DNA uptake protein ComE-like DNA-binding protein